MPDRLRIAPPLNGAATAEPPSDCALCQRLVAFRSENRRKYPDFYNGAVRSFGDPAAELLVVGLAPGRKGANRTGRPFTGDYAGNLLYPTLIRHGFARGEFKADPDDGLELRRAMVTNAVRCVPPENKPTGPEIRTCRRFLLGRIAALPRLRAIFLLGRIAHDSVLAALAARRKDYPFAHAAVHRLDGLVLVDSYHCSRYNVNTGRLTPEMFDAAFRRAKEAL